MFQLDLGPTGRYCDGRTRRSFLKLGVAGLASLGLPDLARAKDATPAQVVIAWHLAIGNVVIPKSVTPERIVENFAATEVKLGEDEIEAISALDRGERTGPDPAQFPG